MQLETRNHTTRGLALQLHAHGPTNGPCVLLLHGLFDTGASYTPLVAALQRLGCNELRCVAPDWRGHGDSDRATDGYWFPDYLGDLDALIADLSPNRPVVLIGHSMGGQVASMYAGARPDTVSHLISLDSLNVPDAPPEHAPDRYRRWLNALREPLPARRYATLDDAAARIARRYPELDDDIHSFLAAAWTRPTAGGGFELACDPRHRWPFPYGFRAEEAKALWREVTAATLCIDAENSFVHDWLSESEMAARRACFERLEHHTVADCGHMLHLQAPDAVARLIHDFLKAHPAVT